ncbi:hypothetical protein B9Z55_017550 [Caenorhabditis nigoni]|nr:hypothetical protein B9Z55_017550 [Caenorhabditis nigoni]
MGYKSYLEGTEVFVLANGDFIDTMNLDKFYYDPEHRERCKSTDAIAMYRPYFDQMKRNVFQPLCHQKISLIEFLALVTLCTWNDSLEGQPDSYYPLCRPVRQKVIAELMSFYEKDTPDVDPAYRLSGLLMLLPALEGCDICTPRHLDDLPATCSQNFLLSAFCGTIPSNHGSQTSLPLLPISRQDLPNRQLPVNTLP